MMIDDCSDLSLTTTSIILGESITANRLSTTFIEIRAQWCVGTEGLLLRAASKDLVIILVDSRLIRHILSS